VTRRAYAASALAIVFLAGAARADDPRARSREEFRRGVALVKAGGNWGDKQGAADQMMDIFKKNESKGAKAPNLPSLDAITGASSTPTPKPKP